ncbi:MAG: M48 family metallopeptidase [Sulfuritalea sp.]|nr:M48 family metallopeptidase [Sulfuritalea sp.]
MIDVTYFDGKSSRRHPASLELRDGLILIEGSFGRRSEPLSRVEIGESTEHGISSIQFADGALCEISDAAAFAALLARAGSYASPVVAAQKRWRWALAALAGSVLAITAIYAYALPWIAKTMAPRIPVAVTQALSTAVLEQLDARLLVPSKLPSERQQQIAAQLARLTGADAVLPPHRLLFRSGPRVGPNAFALPGGEVVVLDELVALAKRDEEVVAVIAHELGHLRYHHGMRQLIQSSVVSFAVGIYLGDVSTVIAGLTALLLESRYSRAFEMEADAYAGRLLLASSNSLEPLIEMLQRLELAHTKTRKSAQDSIENPANLLSTHPDMAERMAALRTMKRH